MTQTDAILWLDDHFPNLYERDYARILGTTIKKVSEALVGNGRRRISVRKAPEILVANILAIFRMRGPDTIPAVLRKLGRRGTSPSRPVVRLVRQYTQHAVTGRGCLYWMSGQEKAAFNRLVEMGLGNPEAERFAFGNYQLDYEQSLADLKERSE